MTYIREGLGWAMNQRYRLQRLQTASCWRHYGVDQSTSHLSRLEYVQSCTNQ